MCQLTHVTPESEAPKDTESPYPKFQACGSEDAGNRGGSGSEIKLTVLDSAET